MAYNRINKLDRTFVPGQILYAREVTESDSKTNEIIDTLNGIGPDVDNMDVTITNVSNTVTSISNTVTVIEASIGDVTEMVDDLDSSVEQLSQDVSNKMNSDGSNYVGSKPLVTPVMISSWKIYNQEGEEVGTSTSNSLTLEKGAVCSLKPAWKWESREGYKNPTACSGSFSSVLPASGQIVDVSEKTNLATDRTYTQKLIAPASGLVVKNGLVVKAEGNDETSASITLRFCGRQYYGGYEEIISTAADLSTAINSLENNSSDGTTKLNSTWVNTGNGIKILYGETGSELKYIYFIYPKSWGFIEKTTTDGAVTYSDWDIKTISLENTYGSTEDYYVYRTTGKKTTGTNGIVFRFYKVN